MSLYRYFRRFSGEVNDPNSEYHCLICGEKIGLMDYIPVGSVDTYDAKMQRLNMSNHITLAKHLLTHCDDEFLAKYGELPINSEAFAVLLGRELKRKYNADDGKETVNKALKHKE